MKIISLPVTTDASGDGTSDQFAVPGGGVLYAVQCVDGTFDDGVDVDITSETGDLAIAVFSVDNFNTDIIYYPRVLENLNTDGTALTTHCPPLCVGRVKAVVAAGGNAKSGSFVLYIAEL